MVPEIFEVTFCHGVMVSESSQTILLGVGKVFLFIMVFFCLGYHDSFTLCCFETEKKPSVLKKYSVSFQLTKVGWNVI